ncbi:LLM class flavin-dependent oxidoreductase [Pseudonocardia humida]|uniref:LLM class flavin-dependent oxidoreductase n=1 Tax=Pseudonocardia humida TaxID=2800819 RepID=A0ABT0ZSY3_9PSEU|nr:LLM class flavin-dependent oxidoreductase [Pseudonocardia humida]MCO1653795.1 LLM class flavin-dependent oxidoreductase [Pseudonocardia humida]
MPAAARAAELEFGLFDWVDAVPGSTPAEVYDGRLGLLAEADEGGFAVYHLAEHHGTPLGMAPSPAVFLAAAARTTRRIRLAPTTFVVPLHDPLRLAEEIAMLDQLSHGRLEVGVGRGSSPFEAAMYGLGPGEAAERFDALVGSVLEALETGVFRRPGGGADVPLHLPVHQRPHPPLWYPTSNPASVPRLGERGYSVLFGFGFAAPAAEVVREQREVFLAGFRAARERGAATYRGPRDEPRFGIMRHVLVAPTDAEAAALARPAFADHYASFAHLWRAHGSDRFTTTPDVEALAAEGRFLLGSPRTVAGQVAAAVGATGVDYLAGAFAWGSLDPAVSLRSLRLFRDEVVPAVRTALAAGSPPLP